MKKALLGLLVVVGGVLVAPGISLANPDTDSSDAVRYSGAGEDELGTRIEELDGDDDSFEIFGLDWTMNYFGEPMNAICVSTNGSVSPVFLTDDQFAAWGGDDGDPGEVDGLVADDLQCDSYDDPLTESAEDQEMGSISPLAADITLDWESDDCTECSGGSIWIDSIEIDGKEAVAVTWDEVSMYSSVWGDLPDYSAGAGSWSGDDWQEGDWIQERRNTFQVVLIKEAGGDEDDGFDFTIEFNYGTVGDGSDGYGSLLDEHGEPVEYMDGMWLHDCGDSQDYDMDGDLEWLNDTAAEIDLAYSMPSVETLIDWDRNHLCRWPIGISSYDVLSGTGTAYELFPATPVGDLTDGGASELIGNSRGSAVDGRYVIEMIGGSPLDLEETDYEELFDYEAQFEGYWESTCARCTGARGSGGGGDEPTGSTEQPEAEPAASTAAGGRALIPGTLQPVSPLTRADGTLPSVAPGAAELIVDEVTAPTSLMAGSDGAWTVSDGPVSLTVDVSSAQVPTIADDEAMVLSGTGMEPGSLVDVWAFSTPTFLGSFTVGSDGTFAGSILLPPTIGVGPHTLQINGTTADGKTRSLNLGVQVVDRNFTLPKTGGSETVALVAMWLMVAGALVTVAARRRRVIG